MRHFLRIFTRKDIFAFAAILCVYILLALQSYPLSQDDFLYRFNQSNDAPILSLMDLLASNIFGYSHINGRFLVHTLVQTYMAWNMRLLFIISSAIACILLCSSIIYLIRRQPHRRRYNSGDAICVLFFLIAFWPLMATSFYGSVAMTINYLWSAAISTFFLSIYFHVSEDKITYSTWRNIALFIFGLICGSWQESYGIGIGGAICLYHLFNLRRTNKSTYYLIIGYGIGLCILLFAPGNFVRVDIEESNFIGYKTLIYQTIQLCKHNLFVDVWFGLGILSLILDTINKNYFAFIKSNWLFFLSAGMAFTFTLYTIAMDLYQGIWQLTILGVIDTILTIKFLQTYLPKLIESKTTRAITVITMCIFTGATYGYRHVLKIEKQAFIDEFVSHKSDTAYDGKLQYVIQHSIPAYSDFIFEHTCDMYCYFYNENTLPIISRYYTNGSKSWGNTLLPEHKENIIANCIESNKVSEFVYLAPLKYYIIRIPKGNDYSELSLHMELEKRRKKRRYYNESAITSLPRIEDDNYLYAIKTLNWWNFHDSKIKNAIVK